jgi:hypothetical protein
MAFKFNPFTGTLDQTGSGGGASYIDGEVQNFSALPETIGTPAVDSAYLVREAEGTWLLARKPAGIYIRTADTGVRVDDWTHAGAFPDVFSDAAFTVYSDGDPTKNFQLSLSGITTGQTRTITVPDKNVTLDDAGDTRDPNAHAASHAAGGSDPVFDQDLNTGDGVTFDGADISNLRALSLTLVDGDFLSGSQAEIVPSTITDDREIYVPDASGTIAILNDSSEGNITASDVSGLGTAATEDFASPPSIGSTTPNTGAFTTLNATGTTELVNGGTTAGPFRLYNTFTDASNYERGFMRWSSNVLQIGAEKAGTGSARALAFQTNGTIRLSISANSNALDVPNSTFWTSGGTTWLKVSSGADLEFNNLYPRVSGTTVIGATNRRFATVFANNLNLAPSASVTPANNGDLVFEATDNTTLTFKYKGGDGVVRSGTVALS